MELYKQGDHQKAAEKLVQLLDFDKTNSKAWNALGVCLSKLQDYQQARICFLNAVKFDPDNQTYLKNLQKATEKIPKPPEKVQSNLIRKIKRTFSDFAIGTTEYACLALGCILGFIYFLPVILGISVPSPAREIIGLCGIVFILFFILGALIRYLQYLGIKRVHAIIVLIALLIIAFPIYHLLNLEGLFPISSNLSEYQKSPYPPVLTPTPASIPTSTTTVPTPPVTIAPGMQVNNTPACTNPIASFDYEILRMDPFQVRFISTSDTLLSSASSLLWDFGDQQASREEIPVHEYSGSARSYQVNLTIWNECGDFDSIIQIISPVSANITPGILITPSGGVSPLTISCQDLSIPLSNITGWRWTFGDGDLYETNEPGNRNTSHTFSRPGRYYVTLSVQNRYHQVFSTTSLVTVSGFSTISGYLWNDGNQNGIRELPEKNQTGWMVALDRKSGSQWRETDRKMTDQNGAYQFQVQDNGGIYRVRTIFPANGTYEITNADNLVFPNVSLPFPLYQPGSSYQHNVGIIESIEEQYHEISLMSSRPANISPGGEMTWHPVGNDGIITINGSSFQLKDGSACRIRYLNESSSAQISIAGGLEGLNLSPVSFSMDNAEIAKGNCSKVISSLITGYTSTLRISLSPDRNAYTTLIWDGAEIPLSWRDSVTISGLMPTENQYMELNLTPGRIFFSGRAISYAVS